MKKSAIFKLLMIVIAVSALLLLFACDKSDENETAKPSVSDVESGTETETESESTPVSETENDGSDESENSSNESESNSETETETKCEHPYAAKPEGHWKPACDVCGKKEGKVQDHEYVEFQEDEGDLIYYSYVCKVCGYEGYGQEVPYEINLFYPASEIANLDASGGLEGVYNFVSGIGYATFARNAETAGANSTVYVEETGSVEDDPVGKFMAIKLRLPRSQTSVSLQIHSVHADKAYVLKLNNIKPGWVVLLIDLSKVQKTLVDEKGNETTYGYFADPDDEYYLKYFTISAYIGSGESMDISYVAFCDEYEDAASFLEGENNYYIYHDAINKEPEKHITECKHDFIIDDENGTHTLENPCFVCGMVAVSEEPHTYVEIIGNGKNSYECSVCGHAKYTKLVPDEVNKYYSASELNAGGIIYYPYTGFNHGLYVEDGDAYTRYEGPTSLNNGDYFKIAQVIFARDDKDQNPVNNGEAENGIRIDVGDAVYFVLRVRVNTDNLAPLNVTISTTGHAGYDSKEGNATFSIPVGSTPKDGWNTYVINLAEAFPTKYIKDAATGNYVVDTYYFNICGYTFYPGVTLDLSYMAYCSTWEEVAGLVDEEQVFLLADGSGNGSWVSTEDRGCVGAHIPGDAEIKVDEVTGIKTYNFICSLCGQPAASKTVDPSVTRYYYPGEIASTAKTYFQLNGASGGKGALTLYDEENEFVYSRFTGMRDANNEAGTAPVTGQALWQRAQADMWAGQTSGAAEQYTESVGNAEWLVIRARSSNSAQNFQITYSTTMYNAEEGAALGRMYGGMVSFIVPFNAVGDDEWATYVVNLKELDPVSYVKDDMGTPDDPSDDQYIIDSFYIAFSNFPKSASVDIEYMAFIDGSWAEIDALVEDESVVVISDKTGSYGMADAKTGECLEGAHAYGYSSETHGDGSMTNKVACAVCGATMREQNVSKDINKFFDITSVGCFYQVHAEDPKSHHSDAKVQGIMLDEVTGDRFVRIAATFGNTHINLTGGAGGGNLTSFTIDTGRYAVLKFRADGRGFAFDAQTGDFESHKKTVYSKNDEDAGKWLIFVIDLDGFEGANSANGYTTNSEQTVKFRLTTDGTERDGAGWYVNDPYTIDIAYLAVVDDIAEAESIIGGEAYRLYENGLDGEYVEKNVQ